MDNRDFTPRISWERPRPPRLRWRSADSRAWRARPGGGRSRAAG